MSKASPVAEQSLRGLECKKRKRLRTVNDDSCPKVLVRPPKWYGTGASSPSEVCIVVQEFRVLQLSYLDHFRRSVDSRMWQGIHNRHFDWWQFPIDDGSRDEFNMKSESDIAVLRSHEGWLTGYLESVRLVSKAWGWDVDARIVIKDGGFWDKKDVRLAKIIRSLWLFEQVDYFESMQLFAHHINDTVYNGRGLFYGRICLDEVLYMKLSRR